MSKYIYTTIYEQFTGLKPPEPKEQKPKRRRGYGHPYRMRLNMQEEALEQKEMASVSDFNREMPETSTQFQQPREPHSNVRRFNANAGNYRSPSHNSMSYRPVMVSPSEPEYGHSSSAEPRVTYKKRRNFAQEADASEF